MAVLQHNATLGGNATLIGASATVVTAGICARDGKSVTFLRWLRYGLRLTACQLAAAALCVLAYSASCAELVAGAGIRHQ